jgi:large subunit ribosomal protein L15
MSLSNLTPAAGAVTKYGNRKSRKRKGRGVGTGNGKTAGRGHKGQKSRSGGGIAAGFEGGQMPLHRRLPKRGFTNIFAKDWSIVNLETLDSRFDAGETVDAASLAAKGLIWSRWVRPGEGKEKVLETHLVKVLGRGEMTKKLSVKANKFSKSAAEAIVAAGGEAEVI